MTVTTVAVPQTRKPRYLAPPMACDSHAHIFGPFDQFPPLRPSSYALPEAGPDAYGAMLSALGFTRGVVVQPAPYANEPAAMLSAIRQAGRSLKGIAVADASVPPQTLEAWADAGVAGLRFIEARTPAGERYPGSVGFDALGQLAPVMRELGLHAQLWGPAQVVTDALPGLLRHKVPLVIDHMAMLTPDGTATDKALADLLSLLDTGEIWIKLVLCRIERVDMTGGSAVRTLHNRLLEARPDRMLWGSDWPYVRLMPPPDAAAMLDLFAVWVNDAGLLQQVLVDNPEALYNF